MPIDVLVIIEPKPGKEKRVHEVIAWVTERIRESEPGTLKYHSYRTDGDAEGTVDYVVLGRFKNEDAIAQRRHLDHHQEVGRIIKDEDLLRRPLRYMKLEPATGFDR